MPRGKKSTPTKSPSASFLGDDPVFEEDDEVETPVPVEKPAPVVRAVPPPLPPSPPVPTWDVPVRVHEVDHPLLNKPMVLFSNAQYAALLDYLVESRAGLPHEKQRAFDEGHMGQIMKNLRG
jgi:hypothetical protein